jgi:DNA mismatch repair protein MutS2
MNIFPDNSLLLEEFNKVIALAHGECNGDLGREIIDSVVFSSDFATVLKMLEETDEMRRVLSNAEPFPLELYPEIRPELKLLKIRNAVLSPQQVLQIGKVLSLTAMVFGFFKDRTVAYPLLFARIGDWTYDKEILAGIQAVMDDNGFVLSSASPDLSRIRKNLGRKRAEAEQVYQHVIQKFRKNGWLTESEESWRSGRRVISIQAEQKRSAKGIIHDLSATGKTCFIEPEEAIGINNLVLSLEEEERAEVLRILRELTAFLRGHHTLLQAYFDLLGRYDAIGAKARLAMKMKAALPYVDPVPKVEMKEARHPLLFLYNTSSGRKTIPFDLTLKEDERILVISGPNAGGKTVCMKAVGLMQLMLQSGFLVPVDGNSRFGIFRDILVDIGDSQSLEFELSTYSSRLKHMRIFLQKSSPDTLFLIDEFGTGTDPSLGGALAEAILEELNNKKAVGIITTHFMNLKVLADRTRGIINGSMAFDSRKLEPLYRLEVGKPGSSYTFVVAERSGLPHFVINKARKKVKRNNLLLEELLTKVEREKGEVNRLMEINKAQEKRLQELVNKYEKNVASQEQKMEQNEERARQKELRLTRQMEEKFTRFVKDWKEAKNKKAVLDKYNRNLQERKNTLSEKEQLKLDELIAYNRKVLRKGVLVRLRSGKVAGIVDNVKGDKVTVVFGNVKTTAEMGQLLIVEQHDPRPPAKKNPEKKQL